MFIVSDGQRAQFNEFGFLTIPGLLKQDIELIDAEFEAVFRERGIVHDEGKRSCIVPFIDNRAGFCRLIDHPAIESLVSGLLGEDYNYIVSDGNRYKGDTLWHPDGAHIEGRYIKVAFYLDPVGRDSGALRVIPGSHRRDTSGHGPFPGVVTGAYGIAPSEVPCVVLESQPGDVVVFNHNLLHASFGGSSHRRMFTLNFCDNADTPQKVVELEDFVGQQARFWIDKPFTETMTSTAGAERLKHLQQVIDHSGHMPELAARARATMSEPARG